MISGLPGPRRRSRLVARKRGRARDDVGLRPTCELGAIGDRHASAAATRSPSPVASLAARASRSFPALVARSPRYSWDELSCMRGAWARSAASSPVWVSAALGEPEPARRHPRPSCSERRTLGSAVHPRGVSGEEPVEHPVSLGYAARIAEVRPARRACARTAASPPREASAAAPRALAPQQSRVHRARRLSRCVRRQSATAGSGSAAARRGAAHGSSTSSQTWARSPCSDRLAVGVRPPYAAEPSKGWVKRMRPSSPTARASRSTAALSSCGPARVERGEQRRRRPIRSSDDGESVANFLWVALDPRVNEVEKRVRDRDRPELRSISVDAACELQRKHRVAARGRMDAREHRPRKRNVVDAIGRDA